MSDVLERSGPAEALARELEREIASGRLLPGAQLPTVRHLAGERGISPATVASAYKTLQRRGIIISAGRRGTRVADRPPLGLAAAPPPIAPGARNVADGNPDPELLPDLQDVLGRLTLGRPILYGDDTIVARLDQLARDSFAADGIPSERVALTYGALDAIDRILSTRLSPGDLVVVEDPCYPAVLALVRSLSLIPVPCPVDDEGLVPDALERALGQDVQALILTPRAQNPFGSALTEARRDALGAVLEQHPGVVILEDDHASAVAGAPAQTLTRGRRSWAVIRSVTKTYGPDLRLALVTADDETVSLLQGRIAVSAGWVSTILQRILVEAMLDQGVADRVARAAVLYEQRRRALLDALADRGVPAHGASGFNVWLPVADEGATLAHLAAAGWAAASGAPSRIAAAPAVRITTARMDPADAEPLAAVIAASQSPTFAGRGA